MKKKTRQKKKTTFCLVVKETWVLGFGWLLKFAIARLDLLAERVAREE